MPTTLQGLLCIETSVDTILNASYIADESFGSQCEVIYIAYDVSL